MLESNNNFLDYKLVHNFIYPKEPLKSWINSNNFHNHFKDNYDSLIDLINKIQSITLSDENYRSFFHSTNHLVEKGGFIYIDTDIIGVYNEALSFIKTL